MTLRVSGELRVAFEEGAVAVGVMFEGAAAAWLAQLETNRKLRTERYTGEPRPMCDVEDGWRRVEGPASGLREGEGRESLLRQRVDGTVGRRTRVE